MRGYFGIGIENPKTEENVGTLWRSAALFGASFIFTIGRRYRHQASDTMKAWKTIPLYNFKSFSDFYATAVPYSCRLIGVELSPDARPLKSYIHPAQGIYLLGAEDNGLTNMAMAKCKASGGLIVLPGKYSMNVAVAGSIVMYDRITKE